MCGEITLNYDAGIRGGVEMNRGSWERVEAEGLYDIPTWAQETAAGASGGGVSTADTGVLPPTFDCFSPHSVRVESKHHDRGF